MDLLINAEVTASASVITQDDPRHPDYNQTEENDNK